jgi:hypothetical protein
VSRCRPSPRNEKVGLTTTLITRLLINPLAKSRSTADASVQSSPQGPSTTLVDRRWHGRSEFESVSSTFARVQIAPFKIKFRQDSVTR